MQKTTKYTTHKMNQKTKARFGRLLQPLAWKRNGPTLDEVGR